MQNDRMEINSHPLLYRQAVNKGQHPCQDDAKENKHPLASQSVPQPSSEPTAQTNGNHWDCYPNLIREIENHGTDSEVKKLHAMEKTSSE
jgi:hypothetical protein